MASRRGAAASAARASSRTPLPPPALGKGIKNPAWLPPVRASTRLEPGQLTTKFVTVPAEEAQRVLLGMIRFVVDIDADTTPIVVWQREGDELWVDVSATTLTCADGLVQVGVRVGCDQLRVPLTMRVPLGVGTPKSPTGLLLTTVQRLDGPDLVTSRWSDAITAFAWEAVIELARHVCAALGDDKSGLPLVPGALAATEKALLIQPMSRHDLSAVG
ncbi:hypothetical protein ACPPVT_12535 [Angustibacter sp. McL0619]|uniref:hypothetical protein n=1 Tax=Angustibacter sp. McL0619 TaxID=3415676 RepID=UPI003CF9E7FB